MKRFFQLFFVGTVSAPTTPIKIEGKHKSKDAAAIEKVVTDAMDGWCKNDAEQAIAEYSENTYWGIPAQQMTILKGTKL